MAEVSKSLEETKNIASSILSHLKSKQNACVVALSGDLGAGKTALSQAFGNLLGVKDNMQSPTFVIMKIYDLEEKNWQKLIHIDAYRLEREEELLHLGWEEIISNPENLVLIEWPERVSGIIPEDAFRVDLRFIDEETREIAYAI